MAYHAFKLYEMQALVAAQIENFTKFPPRQKPASFNLDAVMQQLLASGRVHYYPMSEYLGDGRVRFGDGAHDPERAGQHQRRSVLAVGGQIPDYGLLVRAVLSGCHIPRHRGHGRNLRHVEHHYRAD
jgi:hypothetical protein